ncbi:hypothetical protein M885DRAFT_405421, partial [Pelagophyceae sp. CCMP2097]
HLPVAATSFGEVGPRHAPEALALSSLERFGAKVFDERSGVAYLYYRCRRHREAFVDLLLQAGLRVDALGKCAGPLRPQRSGAFEAARYGADWHGGAVEAYAASRFVVAFENAQEPGYVTEKMGLAFLAGAIPVYWGHAGSARDIFNADAYVDCER